MTRDIYYFPALHREAAPAAVPGGVCFFSCGLPEGGEQGGAAWMPVKRGAEGLPLPPPQAAAVLDELLRLGREHAGTGSLRTAFSPGRPQPRDREFAELERFVQENGAAVEPVGPDAESLQQEEREARIDCQKILLLAYARERALLEAARLERELAVVESALRCSLGVGEEDAAALGGALVKTVEAGLPEGKDVSWRALAEAMLAFLPAEAALLTGEPAVFDALRESGIEFTLVETVNIPAGLDFSDGELYAAAVPGTVLAGRVGIADSRPWLGRRVQIFYVPSR